MRIRFIMRDAVNCTPTRVRGRFEARALDALILSLALVYVVLAALWVLTCHAWLNRMRSIALVSR